MENLKNIGQWEQHSINGEISLLGGVNYGNYPVIKHLPVQIPPGGKALLMATEAGKSRWRKFASRWRQNCNVFSLELITSGNFHYVQDGREYDLSAGDLFLCKPFKDNEMVCSSIYAEKRTVIIGGTMLLHLMTLFPFSEQDVIHLPEDSPVEKLMSDIELHRRSFARSSGLLMEVLQRITEAALPNPLPETLRAMMEYLEHHLNADFQELSDHFGVSRATIDRLFRRHIGETPRQFIIRRRIETAKRMLLSDQLPLKQIALELGYRDQLYFSRDFHARTGVSPSDYRKQHNVRG